VAGAELTSRPDDRVFVRLYGEHEQGLGRLLETSAGSTSEPLHAIVDHRQVRLSALLRTFGFETTLTEDVFRVAFDRAADATERAWLPNGFSILSATDVDVEDLTRLDNQLRQLVPGTEGWAGDTDAMTLELGESPPFDPSAYLVARDDRAGELVGLIRFWRNPSGPRLGLIATRPRVRGTLIGPALLSAGVAAASTWGHRCFLTETARSNRHVHHRLARLGAEVVRSFDIVRRDPT
jgi:GNAT superfamily N-acetyltransferase